MVHSYYQAKNGPLLSNNEIYLVIEILSGFNIKTLSQENAIEIIERFIDAGISPSKDLDIVMECLGFNAQYIDALAGSQYWLFRYHCA